ncbi:MAG: Asp-tRNA(Asn)/Glu-tRNA(Gln) amidotransferase subunit GatC [Candidatus Paceibacterota bacterium]|jgi:aspartyl-tRNA(Asn)/glutamyl-tRNA(Gln) amidotransferase subunit C
MISEEEIRHIAKLSRLEFSAAQLEKFQKEFSAILEYVESLKTANVEGVEPMAHSVKVANVFRKDDPEIQGTRLDNNKKLLEIAPATEGDYLRSKAVF